MAQLIAEVLTLHKTLHTDRSQSDTLKAECERLIQCQNGMNKRCKQLEEEADRLHKILATRNQELSQELGLQPLYNKCLAELAGRLCRGNFAFWPGPRRLCDFAEANSKLEKLSAKTEQEVTDIHIKLKHSEANEARLLNSLNTEKQAHAVAVASLEQSQQKHVRVVQDLHGKVNDIPDWKPAKPHPARGDYL